jgi:hypothetical protein
MIGSLTPQRQRYDKRAPYHRHKAKPPLGLKHHIINVSSDLQFHDAKAFAPISLTTQASQHPAPQTPDDKARKTPTLGP